MIFNVCCTNQKGKKNLNLYIFIHTESLIVKYLKMWFVKYLVFYDQQV